MNIKERKTQLIIGGVVLGLGVLIYFLFKNKPLGVEVMTANQMENSIAPEPSILDMNLILQKGSKGAEVAEMQKILINKYGQNLGSFGDNKDGIDGVFGNSTLAGLLKAKKVSKIALKDL